MGEGGGQILRSALGLSLVTGKPFRIENIRKKRRKPGLMQQHLTAVKAAAKVGCAKVLGDDRASLTLTFEPGGIVSGDFHFAIGTAGSTSLVLQAILPALLVSDGKSRVTIEGGTHNPWAPPFDFLVNAFVPLLARMGAKVQIELERAGFFPAGGGRIVVTVDPVDQGNGLQPLHLNERGEIHRRQAIAQVANLPMHIAERELDVIGKELGFEQSELVTREIPDSRGSGNIVTILLECEHIAELFTGFGKIGKPAEQVASEAVQQAKTYLESDVPVGRYLADQLLIPLAMAGSGSFRTVPLSRHTLTNIAVIEMFLPVKIEHEQDGRTATVVVAKS